MRLHILSPGPLTTVQDLGRPAWRSSGVPLSGAADVLSHSMANALLGNPDSDATLEIASGGLRARVEQGGWAAHCGLGGSLSVDGVEVQSGRTLYLPDGAVLHIRAAAEGNFSYLAAAGGWDVPEALGSRSTCLAAGFGGLDGRPLRAGDALSSRLAPQALVFLPKKNFWESRWYAPSMPRLGGGPVAIGVLPGPEHGWWTAEQRRFFEEKTFRVAPQRDRMGLRLSPEDAAALRLSAEAAPVMLSAAVAPGTVQVPPDGCPIVLLADAQTTGGYPRIAQVAAADLPSLAQVPTGQSVRFQAIGEEEAERRLWAQRRRTAAVRCFVREAIFF
jgi:biotin-dependent carboxylase-like uncharacterized protein